MPEAADLQILLARIQQFLAAWGERQPERRQALLAESCVEDLSY